MLKEGSKAPHFTLQNQNGDSVNLSDYLGKKVLIWFYPKSSSPGWTIQGQKLRDEFDNFTNKNIIIIGISADSVKAQKNFCLKQNFPFNLLSDPDKKVITSYKAFGWKKFMGREYQGIYRISYLIDEKGMVEKAYEKVKTKEHAKQVLSDFD